MWRIILSISSEGLCSVLLCFGLYVLSVATHGRWSIAHAWIYSGNVILQPTERSVARMIGLPSLSSTSSSALDGMTPVTDNRRRKRLWTVNEQLCILELSGTVVLPGSIAAKSIKQERAAALWISLDFSVILCVSCFLFVILNSWLGRLFLCLWLTQQSIELDRCELTQEHYDPSSSSWTLTVILVILAIRSWWRLALRSSQAPLGVRVGFLPFSFVLAVGNGLMVYGLLTELRTIGSNIKFFTDTKLSTMELAVRSFTWLRLVGWKANSEITVSRIMLLTRLLVAIVYGSIFFGLSQAVQANAQAILYRIYIGDRLSELAVSEGKIALSSFAKSKGRLIWKLYTRMALVGLVLIPVVILLTYCSEMYTINSVRSYVSWGFLAVLCTMMKTFQQDYLQSAVPALVASLDRTQLRTSEDAETDDSNKITYPFAIRHQAFMMNGCKLATAPIMLMLLLTLLQINKKNYNSQNCLLSKANDNVCALATNVDSFLGFPQQQRNENNIDGDFLSVALPNESACPYELLSVATETQPEAAIKELLANPPVNTLVDALRELQVQIRTRSVASYVSNCGNKEDRSCGSDTAGETVKAVLSSLLVHPILTASSAYPLLDLLQLLFFGNWTIFCAVGFLQDWPKMKMMRLQADRFRRIVLDSDHTSNHIAD